MADETPRRLRRHRTDSKPEPMAGPRGHEGGEGMDGHKGKKKHGGFLSGVLGGHGGGEEKAESKFYYEPAGDEKQVEAGKAGTGLTAEAEDEPVDKEELARVLYEQLEMERQLRKETAKLALKEIKNFRRSYMRYPEEHEYEQIADNIYQQIKETYEKAPPAAGEPAAGGRRRRYMEAGAAGAAGAEGTPAGVVPEAGPGGAGRGAEGAAQAKLPAKPASELVAETQGISVKGLFEAEAKAPLELSELAQPAMDLGLGELENELKMLAADDIQTVGEEMETTRNKCPTCSTRTEDIVFCPHCGSGFCTHCTLKAELLGDRIKYSCPDCKKEVSVRKQAR